MEILAYYLIIGFILWLWANLLLVIKGRLREAIHISGVLTILFWPLFLTSLLWETM